MSSFIPRNLTEIEAITGCTFACICNTVFRMFSCLQINCQPFYLRQLLKFHQFEWLIEIYLQTEGQGTHHKMVSLQPMSGFSPLFKLNRIHYIRCQDSNFKVILIYNFKVITLLTEKERGERKVEDTIKPTPHQTPAPPPTGRCGDIMQQMFFTINLSLHLMNCN